MNEAWWKTYRAALAGASTSASDQYTSVQVAVEESSMYALMCANEAHGELEKNVAKPAGFKSDAHKRQWRQLDECAAMLERMDGMSANQIRAWADNIATRLANVAELAEERVEAER